MKFLAVATCIAIALPLAVSTIAQDKWRSSGSGTEETAKCLRVIDRAQRRALVAAFRTQPPTPVDVSSLIDQVAAAEACVGFDPTSIGYEGCRGIPGTPCELIDRRSEFSDYLECVGCTLRTPLQPDGCGNGILEPNLGEECDPPGTVGQCPGCQLCLADCTCNTLPETATCPVNAQGGPNLASFTVVPGTDLDIGWVGVGHDQTVPIGGQVFVCLNNSGTSADPHCTGSAPVGLGSLNGTTLGPPVPLVAGDVAMCVANEWRGENALEIREVNLETGETELAVDLKAVLYLTGNRQRPCPTCSGRLIGARGQCLGGQHDGLACTTEGTTGAFGNVSSDCLPPFADTAGELDITLDPVTTGTTTLMATIPCSRGPCHCPGQARSNNCYRGANDCQIRPTCPDPTQSCCETGDGLRGCFVGDISRTGTPVPLDPPWGDNDYPKISRGGYVASTFCIPPTNSSLINTPVGVPGPGAFVLPGIMCVDSLR